jgi:hypothetical protein
LKQVRKRLTYANVMSTIAVFLVLGGATAFAAHQLGRHSVGARQLKANAVSTAKIKKEAVSRKKIKNSAVDTTKIADGTVAGTDINLASTPFGRVVARMRGSSPLALTESLQLYPLAPNTFTQAADEVDTFPGAVDVTFSAGCTAPRNAAALVMADPANPAKPTTSDLVGLGEVQDEAGGVVNKRIEIGPFPGIGGKFEPGVAKAHTVYVAVEAECKTGSGVSATFGGIDVIGTH